MGLNLGDSEDTSNKKHSELFFVVVAWVRYYLLCQDLERLPLIQLSPDFDSSIMILSTGLSA